MRHQIHKIIKIGPYFLKKKSGIAHKSMLFFCTTLLAAYEFLMKTIVMLFCTNNRSEFKVCYAVCLQSSKLLLLKNTNMWCDLLLLMNYYSTEHLV